MSKSNNIVDDLTNIYMESIQSSKTLNERSTNKVYAIVYQHDNGELNVVGVYSSPQAAQQALEEEQSATRNRPGEGFRFNIAFGRKGFTIRELPLDQPTVFHFVDNARKLKGSK